MNLMRRILYKPRTIAPRAWLFQVHLYSGLVAGIYALVIGVTGSALVFQPQMRDWLDRDLKRVTGSGPRITADQALAAVVSAHPGFQATSIRMPADPQDVYRISAARMGGHEFYVNPYTAAITGEGTTKQDFLAWLQQLHFNLLGGKTGRLYNGIGGLALLLLSATGIVIWWPGLALAKRAMSVKWNARWPRLNYDVHSSVGFFTLVFTVVISATGAYFSWPAETKELIGWFSPLSQKTAEPHLANRAAGHNLPLSQLMATAGRMVPGAWVSTVLMPHQPGQPVKLTLMNGGAREYEHSNYVYLDPYTGNVLRVDSVEDRSAGDAVLAWIPPLHYGTFGGGTLVYILWVILGLSPAVLGVSGILMWWNRVAVKKFRKLRGARNPIAVPPLAEPAPWKAWKGTS
jgi:uncharacterized iron-regulated membrane protein